MSTAPLIIGLKWGKRALTESSGNTLILGMPSHATVILVRTADASLNQRLLPAAADPSEN